MKRIIEIFLVTLGLALSAGCSEFLDTVPDNRTTIDTPKRSANCSPRPTPTEPT